MGDAAVLLDGAFGKKVGFAFQLPVLIQNFQGAEQIIRGIVGKSQTVRPVIDQPVFCCEGIIQAVQFSLLFLYLRIRRPFTHLQVDQFINAGTQGNHSLDTFLGGRVQLRAYHDAVLAVIYLAVHNGIAVVLNIRVGGNRVPDCLILSKVGQFCFCVGAMDILDRVRQLIGQLK